MVVDGLALGAMPEVIEREALRLRIVALVHLPLAADVSIDRETATRLEASERRALACCGAGHRDERGHPADAGEVRSCRVSRIT